MSPKPTPSNTPVEETHFPASQQGASATELILGCPCGQRLKVARDAAGKQVRCPACKRLLQVPISQAPTSPSTVEAGATLATQNKRTVEETLHHDPQPAPGGSTTPHIPGPSTNAPIQRFGDYEILGEIARGGMGVVYKARQVSLNRVVALKMILSQQFTSRDAIERFQREARAAATLDHPNIVPVFEVGEIDGQHFFSMGFVAGGSLQGLVQKGPLPPRQAARLVRLTAEAVQHAHDHGVIHRDLKPHNVLMSDEAAPAASASDRTASLVPKLTDFGLARIAEEGGLSVTGDVMGTPSYMPPEQARGELKEIGPPADIYSLGAVLYCLLTGRPPFQAATPMETMMLAVSKEPLSPRELNPHVPRDLETVCLKCLEKAKGRRYATARELADELGRYERGEPLKARPVGAMERSWRWSKRNPALAGLFVALLLGVIVSTWLFFVAEGQRKRADEKAEDEKTARGKEELARRDAETARDDAITAQKKEAIQRSVQQHLAYTGKLALAQSRWRDGMVQFARATLASCPVESRGWEYGCLDLLYNVRGQRTLGEHRTDVNGVSYSPDGTRLASVSSDSGHTPGEIKVWDTATGKLLFALEEKDQRPYAVAFSPDSKRLAVGTILGMVKIIDLATRKEVQSYQGQRGWIYGLCWSPDGKRIATTGTDCVVVVADLANPAKPLNLRSVEPLSMGLTWSHDGKQIAASGGDLLGGSGEFRVWDADNGKLLWTQQAHGSLTRAICFHPDHRRLATGGGDNTIKIWDTTTRQVLHTLTGHEDYIVSLDFSSDGKRLVSCTGSTERTLLGGSSRGDFPIKVWDVETGKERLTLKGHTAAVMGVRFSPDGLNLASVSWDRTVRVWDAMNGQNPLTLTGHGSSVISALFTDDGKQLVSGGGDGAVRVWDLDTGKVSRTLQKHKGPVFCVDVHTATNRLASSDNTNAPPSTIRLWNLSDGSEVGPPLEHRLRISAISFHPDGKFLAAGDDERAIKIWDLKTRKVARTIPENPAEVFALRYSPDGKYLASGGADAVVHVWDADTGKEVYALKGHKYQILSLCFSADSQRLASTDGHMTPSQSQEASIKVWDMTTGTELYTLRGHTDAINSVGFRPDGKRLLSGSRDRTIKLWDVTTGTDALPLEEREVLSLKAHDKGVRCVGFSHDGKRLLSTSDDGTIRVWESTQTVVERLRR